MPGEGVGWKSTLGTLGSHTPELLPCDSRGRLLSGCYFRVCLPVAVTPGRLVSTNKWETNDPLCFSLFAVEPSFPSRICSSAPLIYFLFICPFLVFLLLVSALCLYWKARKSSTPRLASQREKTLWVGLKGAGDGPTTTKEEEEEDS